MAKQSGKRSGGAGEAVSNAVPTQQAQAAPAVGDGNGDAGSDNSAAAKQSGGWKEHAARLTEVLEQFDSAPTRLLVPFNDAPAHISIGCFGVHIVTHDSDEIVAVFSDGSTKPI